MALSLSCLGRVATVAMRVLGTRIPSGTTSGSWPGRGRHSALLHRCAARWPSRAASTSSSSHACSADSSPGVRFEGRVVWEAAAGVGAASESAGVVCAPAAAAGAGADADMRAGKERRGEARGDGRRGEARLASPSQTRGTAKSELAGPALAQVRGACTCAGGRDEARRVGVRLRPRLRFGRLQAPAAVARFCLFRHFRSSVSAPRNSEQVRGGSWMNAVGASGKGGGEGKEEKGKARMQKSARLRRLLPIS